MRKYKALGADVNGNGGGCGAQGFPAMQDMQNGNVGGLAGYYWRSTGFSGSSTGHAYLQRFGSGNDDQFPAGKYEPVGVCCARAITN